MTTREIPFSLDAEESLLGNILLFPQSLRECLQEDLQSEDFYLEKNQKIYTVMLNMNERNENIDTISLGSKLKDFGLFDKIGGMEYLMNLAGKTVGASNTKEYIRIIKSKSISRQIIKAGEEISRGQLIQLFQLMILSIWPRIELMILQDTERIITLSHLRKYLMMR